MLHRGNMPAMPKYQFTCEVEPQYLAEQSAPDEEVYAFAYTITITNTGDVTAQLIARHWIIDDARGQTEEVKGLGVVGNQPLLRPGESFQYTSGTRQGNLYEQRTASIAEQLCGEGMALDFDQLLAKAPGRDDAVFGWHQDQAYWIDTDDRRTATCWLAVDDSTLENGCLQFLPGSNHEPVRPHRPLHEDRTKSHTLITDLRDDDVLRPVPISRGDITVHGEGILHGSGGNTSAASWRRAYIVAYRSLSTVEAERRLGFTHSHNDGLEVLDNVDGLVALRESEGDA